MSEKKDYLSQLAEDIKKPESFKEEKFERVSTPGVNINPKLVGGVIAVIALLGVVAYFLFMSPSIVMPYFVGSKTSDVGAWLKQEGIQSTGIVIKEEYSFEYDKDVILSQSIEADKKIKEDAKITFVASLGADPDEYVAFMSDVLSCTKSDVQNWVDENKLTGVKFEQVYDDNVEENYIISFDLKGISSEDFRRSTNVTFKVSRGAQPAGTITMEDFVKKTLGEVETFAKSKNIVIESNEVYSDEIDAGLIISQSIASGKTMKQGETLSVTVSKGVAVEIPNFMGYTDNMLTAWLSDESNNVTIIKNEKYNEAIGGTVIGQSLSAGSRVDQGTVLELTISLYMPQLQTNSREWLGQDYLALNAWVDDANGKGANIYAGAWLGQEYSDEFTTPGQIIYYECLDANGNTLVNGCDRPLPIDAKITYKTSLGPKTTTTEPATTATFALNLSDYAMFSALCDINGVRVSVVEDSAVVSGFEIYDSADINTKLSDGSTISADKTYIVKVPVPAVVE